NCPFETVIRLFFQRWQMALRSNSINSSDCLLSSIAASSPIGKL
ncbi:MAG: hypothetical protein ACI9UD_002334, partial [Glaciecola sp.]